MLYGRTGRVDPEGERGESCRSRHRRGVGAGAASLLDDAAARYGLDPEAIGTTNGSGRVGEPDEIGYGVPFFASDASSFCSGQTLYIHRGPGPAGV